MAAILGRSGRRGYIVDTRTSAAVQAERAKGGGCEVGQFYPRWKHICKAIDR